MFHTPLSRRLAGIALFGIAVGPLQAVEKPTSVAVQMKRIAEDFKALAAQAADPSQKDSSLARADAIREAITISRPLVPSPALGLEGSELEGYLTVFQRGLDEFDTGLEKLSQAIRAGDPRPIAAAIAEINQLKKTYHSDLR